MAPSPKSVQEVLQSVDRELATAKEANYEARIAASQFKDEITRLTAENAALKADQERLEAWVLACLTANGQPT